MRISKTARFGGAIAFGAVAASTLGALFASDPAWAAQAKPAVIGRIETPLGAQGTRGAGPNVGIIFNLIDDTRRRTDVQVQFGYDGNTFKDSKGVVHHGVADGVITEDEYQDATEDRSDTRDTRRNRKPTLFTTAGDIGAIQQFVWKSTADVRGQSLLTIEYALTAQGRDIPDPTNPALSLFAVGPGEDLNCNGVLDPGEDLNGNNQLDLGSPVLSGVKVRARAFRTVVVERNRKPVRTVIYGDWTYSQSFGLSNNNPPSVTIDGVDSNGQPGPESDEDLLIHWTVTDPDSEDKNGNGVLDDGEDTNTPPNGLDCEKVGVAFDYHRVAGNENPAAMSVTQLAALQWLPCTRTLGVGDTDSMDARPGCPIPTSGDLAGLCSAPPGVGRHYVFAWNSVSDVGTVFAPFIFRARAFDQKRERGDYTYLKNPVQVDNRKIFNPGGPVFPIDSLVSGRVGHTVTHENGIADPNDPTDRGELQNSIGFQAFVVAGGAEALNTGGTQFLDLMSINTLSAETSTAARVEYALTTARAYHSATSFDDGRILFAGGLAADGVTPLRSTEIWDPRSRSIRPGPQLNVARFRHAAVKLASGDVAIFGGIGAGATVLNSCEIIHFQPSETPAGLDNNPANWPATSMLPAMANAQHSLHAVLLPDQTVLLTGGLADVAGNIGVTAAQLYTQLDDITTQGVVEGPRFLATASPMRETRRYGAATALLDGNVLFTGGAGAGTASKTSMEVFNWQTRAFEAFNAGIAMQVARSQHTAVLLGDGSVLLAGGTTDPDAATPPLVGDADVFKLGVRGAGGTWAGSANALAVNGFFPVNGDERTPRRLSPGAAIDNGRVFIAGGISATGPTATLESFTPASGTNLAPSVRTTLPASDLSWSFGAPIYYRLSDPELDLARVEVQYIDHSPGGAVNWRSCTPQATTIGGDVAEVTAGLVTASFDDVALGIDPVTHNSVGDHAYIWAISADVARPPVGGSTGPYNVRVLPYGAVRGKPGVSSPLTVLRNTKIVPTVLPFENYANNRPDNGSYNKLTGVIGPPTNNQPAGTLTPNQGGDVTIWVHLRDIDGGGVDTHTNGDIASCFFEYGVDLNGDGAIKADDGELFKRMTPQGEPVNHPATPNPQVNLKTYSDAYTASGPEFPNSALPADDPANTRRPSKGWTSFKWDASFDLGTPLTSFTNIIVRVTPSDAGNTGFIRIIRNVSGQPAVLRIIRHPDALYLTSWSPHFSGNKAAMPLNDPIDFFFNGQIEFDPLNPGLVANCIQVYRNTTNPVTARVQGNIFVKNLNTDPPTSIATFYPAAQNYIAGVPQFGINDASTVLFTSTVYSFRLPGYQNGSDPQIDPPFGKMFRPKGQSVAGGQYSTYRLVKNFQEDGIADSQFRFTTAASGAGMYANDGQPIALAAGGKIVAPGSMIPKNSGAGGLPAVSFVFNHAVDVTTAVYPIVNVKMQTLTLANGAAGVNQQKPIVPGNWTVQNSQSLDVNGNLTSQSTLTFVPLLRMPPQQNVDYSWTTGLKGVNGAALAVGDTTTYQIQNYGARINTSFTETFDNKTQSETTVTSGVWGDEPCFPLVLSGATPGISGIGTPVGTLPLTINAGETITAPQGLASKGFPVYAQSQAFLEVTNLTIAKGGTLVIDSTGGPFTIRCTGTATIDGTLTFKAKDGVHGLHGNGTGGTVIYYTLGVPISVGTTITRLGGSGRNGGGDGGASVNSTTDLVNYRRAGNDGVDATGSATLLSKGIGGWVPTETATTTAIRYYYGAGGGGGGGNATGGLLGGLPNPCYAAAASWGQWSNFAADGVTRVGGFVAGDAFQSAGPNGGGGGGGGGTVDVSVAPNYYMGGGGGAGAGAVTVVCNGAFTLGVNGLVDGRGGNGGNKSIWSGAGGGGAGGTFRVISNVSAVLDGVIDLRGGIGGPCANIFGQYLWGNIGGPLSVNHPAGFGGDGGLGRLLVVAPNFTTYDEIRVFGQVFVRKITTMPPLSAGALPAVATQAAPFGTATGNFIMPAGSEQHWLSLTINAGIIIDVQSTVNQRWYIDGPVNINGTLRLNGASAEVTSGYNPSGQNKWPPTTGTTAQATFLATPAPGMIGNLGGGDGGKGHNYGTNAFGREATDGLGPQSNIFGGKHLMKPATGGTVGTVIYYSGDSGGQGGANATDGEEAWAPYSITSWYNYLGVAQNVINNGAGVTLQSGVDFTVSPASAPPKRVGFVTTASDISTLIGTSAGPTTATLANLGNFAGSGGGGGNCAGYQDTVTATNSQFTYAGIGGGGAGSLAIITGYSAVAQSGQINIPNGASIEARGGDGQELNGEGSGAQWRHAGGGGGSGGTVYLIGKDITIGAVTPTTGLGGATFDLRGGWGGGKRGNQAANPRDYPEYYSCGSFGGSGGYGRLIIDYTTTLNTQASGKLLVNHWGMEPAPGAGEPAIDVASRTYKTLAGTARYYCPGILKPANYVSGSARAQTIWRDLGSISPIVSSYTPNPLTATAVNATIPLGLQVQGAQSIPSTGLVDGGSLPDGVGGNTSGFFSAGAGPTILQGWRYFRWRIDFTRTNAAPSGNVLTSPTPPVQIDNVAIFYTTDPP